MYHGLYHGRDRALRLWEVCNSTPLQPCCSRLPILNSSAAAATARTSSASSYTTEMKGLVAGYASSGDEASSSDDEPAKPPRAAVREGPRAGRRESRWAIQARAILPPDIRAALEGGAAWSDDDDGAAPAAAAAAPAKVRGGARGHALLAALPAPEHATPRRSAPWNCPRRRSRTASL